MVPYYVLPPLWHGVLVGASKTLDECLTAGEEKQTN